MMHHAYLYEDVTITQIFHEEHQNQPTKMCKAKEKEAHIYTTYLSEQKTQPGEGRGGGSNG